MFASFFYSQKLKSFTHFIKYYHLQFSRSVSFLSQSEILCSRSRKNARSLQTFKKHILSKITRLLGGQCSDFYKSQLAFTFLRPVHRETHNYTRIMISSGKYIRKLMQTLGVQEDIIESYSDDQCSYSVCACDILFAPLFILFSDRALAVCLGPAVARGCLTSCGKDCTTRVHVTMRTHL